MIGTVLAGGPRAAAEVGGRPLAAWPADALASVCTPVEVVWDAPAEPRPALVHALERAGGPVLVCAAEMPFVTPDACHSLLEAAGGAAAPAVVAATTGELRPQLGLYAPAALDALRTDATLTDAVESLDPVRVALPPALVRTVETEAELAAAEELLAEVTRLR
jgi:molybdopterin-guanine dinucleotide biosynthesis protein A